MKIFLSFLVTVLLLSSCTPSAYRTSIKAEKDYPSLDGDKPVYVYYAPEDIIPDDAILIGTFTTSYNNDKMNNVQPTRSGESLLSGIVDEAQVHGANLVLIEKTNGFVFGNRNFWDDNTYLSGKVYQIKEFERTKYTEDSLKVIWKSRKTDKLEGIYEENLTYFGKDNNRRLAKYAIIQKDSSNYLMLYLDGYEELQRPRAYLLAPKNPLTIYNINRIWETGDVKAYIQKTEKSYVYQSNRLDYNKYFDLNNMIKFESGNLTVSSRRGNDKYRKIYPDSSRYEVKIASLTGFAMDKNKIITCYHGITKDYEKYKIFVKGINGDFEKKYLAVIDKYDRANDIAVIRLEDPDINVNLKYFPLSEVEKATAEEVFVIGYPASSVMGDEIKVTNGLVSSTTGAGGDAKTYQISAPIQPGNSGSPLFDKNGNFIGMVNSGIAEADNVGYSIKYKYIKEFLNNNSYKLQNQPENSMKDLSLSDKVKALQNSIYLIEIIDTTPKSLYGEDDD